MRIVALQTFERNTDNEIHNLWRSHVLSVFDIAAEVIPDEVTECLIQHVEREIAVAAVPHQ